MDYLRLPTKHGKRRPPTGFVDVYFDTASATVKYRDSSGTSYPMGGEQGVEAATPSTVVKRTATGQIKANALVLVDGASTVTWDQELIEFNNGDGVTAQVVIQSSYGTMAVLPTYADDSAAIAAGLSLGDLYLKDGGNFTSVTTTP